jgi:transposase-like protein
MSLERLHREVRRRACVVSIFPNPASCLCLVSAVLPEISDELLTPIEVTDKIKVIKDQIADYQN